MKKQKVRKARFHLTISKDIVMPCDINDMPKEKFNKLINSYFEELEIHKHGWIEEEGVFTYDDEDEIKLN